MKGKLIVIEGTDCSGKDTQSQLLIDSLRKQGHQVEIYSFPNYESPSGKIIGDSLLGRNGIEPLFAEGAPKIDPKVSALYYAADRKYNIHKITWLLENGIHVILDRYVYSNMAHQGCKIEDKKERYAMYDWLETLEFQLLELPRPDIAVLLHVPVDVSIQLQLGRISLDENEKDKAYLKQAEEAYLELCERYQFHTIECSQDGKMRAIEDIQQELTSYILAHGL